MKPLEYTEMIEFSRIYGETYQLYHTIAVKHGLSDCALWVLYALRITDKRITQTEICEMVYMPRQTVNSAIKKLVASGHIAFEAVPGNNKNKHVVLTDKGLSLAKASADMLIDAEISAYSSLAPNEAAQFIKVQNIYRARQRDNLQAVADGTYRME